jgi:starch synthase
MSATSAPTTCAANFVVATPQRSVCDDYARALERRGLLRLLVLGTRRGTRGVAPVRTRLNPSIGLATYITARFLKPYAAESCRFRLLPWFDRWALRQLKAGDHVISSYGYANRCFEFARASGGKTFVDAGNSHIENFWEVLTQEQRRWNSVQTPVSRYWYERSRAMLAGGVDYILSPSKYVTDSFLARGFRPDQILPNIYPVDLSLFQPADSARPKDRPLTVINTGALSLRKGTPYLLEAFRLIRAQHPSARFLLTRNVREDVAAILGRYNDLTVDWAPGLPHLQLAERLRQADVFVLPSLEEGLVRTALEAMACGLQVVLTPNTGASDFVESGVNGEIVPIRDPAATAEAVLRCWERSRQGVPAVNPNLRRQLSFDHFEQNFIAQIDKLGLS